MNLFDQLKRDEGAVPYVYEDSEGYATIGVGFLVDRRRGGGLQPNEIDYILRSRVERVRADCTKIPQLANLDPIRLDAVVNMCYNLGFNGLLGFTNMLDAALRRDWETMAKEMLGSKWAGQVGDRAQRLAKQILTGEYQ